MEERLACIADHLGFSWTGEPRVSPSTACSGSVTPWCQPASLAVGSLSSPEEDEDRGEDALQSGNAGCRAPREPGLTASRVQGSRRLAWRV